MTTVSNTLLSFFILLSSFLTAQQPQAPKMKIDTSGKNQLIKKSQWEGGLLLGGTVYSGDIELSLTESRPILGLFVRHAMGNYFAFQTSLSQGFLSGNEAHSTSEGWRAARKISFKSSLTELVVRGEFHFLGNTHKVQDVKSVMDETSSQTFKQKERLISPFVYVGGGLTLTNPKTDFNDSPLPNPVVGLSRVAADKAAKFSKILAIIPFGGGLRIPWVNKQAFFTIEGGFRPTFSDYLDGVSVAGNPTVNDWYFVGDIALSKFFGSKKDSDGDGIADKNDLCPFLKGDIKLNGCPDRDNDGISDDKDVCPLVAGLAIYEGCPDTDGDGIIDKYDDCPNERGLGQFKGCMSEKNKKDSTTVGLDTIKALVDSANQRLNPVDITKSVTQNVNISLSDNTTKPALIAPSSAIQKTTEKTEEALREITTIEPELPIDNKEKPKQTVVPSTPPPSVRNPSDQYVEVKPSVKPADMPTMVVDTTVSVKEKPKQTDVPLPTRPSVRNPSDQYVEVKPSVKPAGMPTMVVDTTVSVKEKPKQAIVPPTTRPSVRNPSDQYVEVKPSGQPMDVPTPTTVVDTSVSVKAKPKQTVVPPTTPPSVRNPSDQYVEVKPSVKPTDISTPTTAVDTTVSIKEKPKQAVDIQKDTPSVRNPSDQYVGGQPIGHPTALPEDIAKRTVAIDTAIVATEKPNYLRPFPTDRNASLDNASVPVTDTNAFNIVRNNYSITPVYFETKKALYKPESFVILDNIASILLDNPKYRLLIKGHTDITGTKESNQILSVNRAKTCYEHLVKRGVPAKRMTFKGFGDKQPAASNATEASRQQNRRVEFEIITE